MSILGITWPEEEISEHAVLLSDSCRDEVISQTADILLDEVEIRAASQDEMPSQLMLKIFKRAIEEYNIAGFMNSDELVPSSNVFDFVNEIKSKVVYPFVGSPKNGYMKISLDYK